MPANFPPSLNARENAIKEGAGYVEIPVFAPTAASQRGYFCSTCKAFEGTPVDPRGYCTGLEVPVKPYGCCNNWVLTAHLLRR